MAASSSKRGKGGKGGGGGGGGKLTPSQKGASQAVLLLIIGLPGSGKSTLSDRLVKTGWETVSQDALGSREECEKVLDKGMRHGKRMILDRVNVHAKERKQWISRVQGLGVTSIWCVWLNLPAPVCKARILSRKDHPTLVATDSFDPGSVVDRFANSMQPPTAREGFSRIHVAADEAEVTAVFHALTVR